MTESNSTTAPVMTFIKDLKLEMNNLSLTFIVLEIGRPTITGENREVRRTVQASKIYCQACNLQWSGSASNYSMLLGAPSGCRQDRYGESLSAKRAREASPNRRHNPYDPRLLWLVQGIVERL